MDHKYIEILSPYHRMTVANSGDKLLEKISSLQNFKRTIQTKIQKIYG